jgi:tetratricopeptide (TPR) repeat protein
LATIGAFYGKRGEYEKAKDYFWKGVDCFKKRREGRLTNELIPGPLLGILYYDLAVTSFREGKINDAIDFLKSVILVDNSNSDSYMLLGDIYRQRNDIDKALSYYEEVLKRDYYRTDVHRQLAGLYAARGDKEKAFAEVEAVVSLDPDYFKAPGEKMLSGPDNG